MKHTAMLLSLLLPLLLQAASYKFVAGRGLVYQWSVGDKTSVSSGQSGEVQRAYLVKQVDASDASYARTNATGYMLSSNKTYYSYVPYRWYDDFDARQIQCSYAGQQQKGNDNADGLYSHDLCISSVTTTTASTATMEYSHVGSVIKVSVKADGNWTPTALTIKAKNDCIPLSAMVNLITKQATLSDYTSSMTLSLSDVTLQKDDILTAYVMMPAVDLSEETLTISLTLADGEKEVAKVYGPKMMAGKLYCIDLTQHQESMAKSVRGEVTATGVEYPSVHAADIAIDNSYSNYLIDIPTAIGGAAITQKRSSRTYTLGGMPAVNSHHGIVIDDSGKKKKN